MPLVIEDGSIKADGNSFATVTNLDDFADARGILLVDSEGNPLVATQKEALLISAMDYIISIENTLQGQRVTPTQPLPFPREGVVLFGSTVDSTIIPNQLIKAQIALAIDTLDNDLLASTQAGDNVVREKVDVLEVEYAENGRSSTFITKRANAFLDALTGNGLGGGFGGGNGITTCRA